MAVDAGTIFADVRIQLDKLKGDITKAETQFDKFQATNKKQANDVSDTWEKSFKKVGLVATAAFVGITLVVKKSIETFATFEQSLANVRSVAGATAEEFVQIEEAARSAGETTRFTASQAADALYNLASAGLDAEESIAALDGVLQLAGATGSDLASTSAAVTSTLSQYSLEAGEAARVSNVFAAAIANSQANMTKLSNAFRQVGPVAGALNISLEETTGVLQALFDAGFKGEQAGTGLRNILASLSNSADPVVQKLTALGFSFEDLDPAVNGLAGVIGTLNEAALESGQVLNAFGKEAGPQILSLLSVGEEALIDYTKAVTDTQAAAEAYATQNDTLQGSIDATSSAIESATIGLVKEFAPALRIIVEFIGNLFRFLSSLPGPIKLFLGLLTGGVAAITGVTVAISALSGALSSLGVSVTAALGPISLVVAGLAGVVAGVSAIGGELRKARLEDIDNRFGSLSGELGITNERMETLVTSMNNLGFESDEAIGKSITKLQEFQQEVGISDEKLDSLIDTAKELGASSENIDEITATVKDLNDNFGVTEEAILEISKSFSLFRGQVAFSDAVESVNELTKSTGLSQKAILKIALTSEQVSFAFKEQLQILENQRQANEDRIRKATAVNEREKAVLKSIKEQQDARNKERERAEKAAAEAEKRRLLEIAATKNIVTAKAEAIAAYEKELRITRLLAKENLISGEDATNREIKATNSLIESLFELGYTAELTEETWTDASGKRVKRIQQGDILLRELIDNTLPGLQKKLKEVEETDEKTFETLNKTTEEYKRKLQELSATEEERIELARQTALEQVRASGIQNAAVDEALKVINDYYDALQKRRKESAEDAKKEGQAWSTAQQDAINEINDLAQKILPAFRAIFSAVDNLSDATAQKQIDNIDRTLQAQLDAYNLELQEALEAAGVAEETKLESLERQLEEAKTAGDKEKENELSNEIERLKINKEYDEKREQATLDAERRKAQIEYEAALVSWNIKLALAVADAAGAIIAGYAQLGPIGGSIAAVGTGVATGIQIAALNEAKPQPPGFQTGGIVLPSGSNGRQVTVAENGSPELLLNAGSEGSALLNDFANRIASAGGAGSGGTFTLVLNVDGKTLAQTSAKYYNNGQVRVEI